MSAFTGDSPSLTTPRIVSHVRPTPRNLESARILAIAGLEGPSGDSECVGGDFVPTPYVPVVEGPLEEEVVAGEMTSTTAAGMELQMTKLQEQVTSLTGTVGLGWLLSSLCYIFKVEFSSVWLINFLLFKYIYVNK